MNELTCRPLYFMAEFILDFVESIIGSNEVNIQLFMSRGFRKAFQCSQAVILLTPIVD